MSSRVAPQEITAQKTTARLPRASSGNGGMRDAARPLATAGSASRADGGDVAKGVTTSAQETTARLPRLPRLRSGNGGRRGTARPLATAGAASRADGGDVAKGATTGISSKDGNSSNGDQSDVGSSERGGGSDADGLIDPEIDGFEWDDAAVAQLKAGKIKGCPVTHDGDGALVVELGAVWKGKTITCQFVDFSGTTFKGTTGFKDTTFTGHAYFTNATFTGHAEFRRATFIRTAGFRNATFTGIAGDFCHTTFTGRADFDNATFMHTADFFDTTFIGTALFRGGTFAGFANFVNASFTGTADFRDTAFAGNISFSETRFKGARTTFDRVKFSGEEAADFTDAQFDLFVDDATTGSDNGDLDGTGDGAGGSCVPALPTFKHTTFGANGANFTNAKLGFCDIEATDLQGSDFDKADCSYSDLVGAHFQGAINVDNACFAPPTPDIGGVWSVALDAEASAEIHVHTDGRAIVGKATFVCKGKPARVTAVVTGRLDRIDTAEARAVLQKQSHEFATEKGSETKVPVHRNYGMPLAKFRMEFLAASAYADGLLLEASGIVKKATVKGKTLLAYVGTVWLVGTTDDRKMYCLRGFVPHTHTHTHI